MKYHVLLSTYNKELEMLLTNLISRKHVNSVYSGKRIDRKFACKH